MNRDDEFIGRLEDYLESFDGATPLPDRVRDAIHANLPRTGQVRPARSSERMLDMISRASTRARWGLVAAVVVAAVVVGAAVVNTGRLSPGVGGAAATAVPSPTPSPAPSPTPTPTPGPPSSLSGAPQVTCPLSTAQCIQPGTYHLSSSYWPGQITLDVPAGWFHWDPASDYEGVLVDSGPDAKQGSGWGLMFMTVGAVSKDPCAPVREKRKTFDPASTSTVDGLVSAMRAWPGFKVTAPTPIVVAGYSGQLVEVTSSLTAADCPTNLIWTTTRLANVDAYPFATTDTTPHKAQFRILDVNGKLLVIRTTDFPETSPNESEAGRRDGPDPSYDGPGQAPPDARLDQGDGHAVAALTPCTEAGAPSGVSAS